MAKKKVKFDLKQDVLAECNKRIRDRLFKKPFSLKPKDYLFKSKVDIEVEDPEWNKKAIEKSLYLNIKRSMQLLSVRTNTLLEEFDKETNPLKQAAQVGKLRKAVRNNGTEVADQAEYNLKQIIDDITKDVAKWGKAGETLNAMKSVDNGKKALEKTVGSLKESLVDVAEKIEHRIDKTEPKDRMKCQKDHEKKLTGIERRKRDQKDDYDFEKRDMEQGMGILTKEKEDLEKSGMKKEDKEKREREIQTKTIKLEKDREAHNRKMARIDRGFRREKEEEKDKYKEELEKFKETTKQEVKGFVKEAGNAYSTYRKDRGDFNKILKDTAKKMHKMVDSKSADNKAIAQLQDMLKKKVKPAAEAYAKDLEKCDKQVIAIIGRLDGNRVSKKEITDAMPKSDLGDALFTAFKAVKKHMKQEKIQ